MTTIVRGSLEHRIIEHASGHYPVTAGELARALHVSAGRLMEELGKMERRGLVELDHLPDKVFIRLLVAPLPVRGGGLAGEEERGPGKAGKRKDGGGDDPAYS